MTVPLRQGVYRHYENGKHYLVDSVPATGKRSHKDTQTVIYFALQADPGEDIKFSCTLDEFIDSVQHKGQEVKRFTYVGSTIPLSTST